MPYTPPTGHAVGFVFVNAGYSPPGGHSVNFVFGGSLPPPPPGGTAAPTGLRAVLFEEDDWQWSRPRYFSLPSLPPPVPLPSKRLFWEKEEDDLPFTFREFSIPLLYPVSKPHRRITWEDEEEALPFTLREFSFIVSVPDPLPHKRSLQAYQRDDDYELWVMRKRSVAIGLIADDGSIDMFW